MARRHGTVAHWPPGGAYGFLTGDGDGMTWYASASETPRREPLAPGTPVTFIGEPEVTPGKSYPRARAIVPAEAGTGALAG